MPNHRTTPARPWMEFLADKECPVHPRAGHSMSSQLCGSPLHRQHLLGPAVRDLATGHTEEPRSVCSILTENMSTGERERAGKEGQEKHLQGRSALPPPGLLCGRHCPRRPGQPLLGPAAGRTSRHQSPGQEEPPGRRGHRWRPRCQPLGTLGATSTASRPPSTRLWGRPVLPTRPPGQSRGGHSRMEMVMQRRISYRHSLVIGHWKVLMVAHS